MAVYNRAKLLALAGNDEDFLEELTETYLADTKLRIEELHQTLSDKDAPATLFLAHSLKGVSGTMTADMVKQAALQMESAVKNQDFRKAAHCLERIESEFARFKAALKE
jgi:HPt (histidine-containing phosphotransfer) domain-containing protein